jgi:hypothetical protein
MKYEDYFGTKPENMEWEVWLFDKLYSPTDDIPKQINEFLTYHLQRYAGNPDTFITQFQKMRILCVGRTKRVYENGVPVTMRMFGEKDIKTVTYPVFPSWRVEIQDPIIDDWIKTNLSNVAREQKYFIDRAYLILIYKEFKDYFPEEKEEDWLRHFIYPLKVKCPEFKCPDESKIMLYAILYSIQKSYHSGKCNFEKDIALDRFSISGFRRKVDYYKENPLHRFPVHFDKCSAILAT